MSFEFRTTVDKDIAIPDTTMTASGSEGAYLKINDFGTQLTIVAVLVSGGAIAYAFGPVVLAAATGIAASLAKVVEGILRTLGLSF